MVEKIQAIRGMNDVLPADSYAWQMLETTFMRCMNAYGYQEIRTPILEATSLFKRTIGEVTDIVEKEMYTFQDLNGDSLTLRPEGTAGCLRACLEHGLLHNQQQKLWYLGPMFRHEKPQKGRYRQFNQLGVEVFGIPGTSVELELILMCKRFWEMLGLQQAVQLQINTIGTFEERQSYRQVLIDYFTPHYNLLDADCQRRLTRSPMRILDSKNPVLHDLIRNAPKLMDIIGDESRLHFETLCAGLEELKIDYSINPSLVRGLDYYGHTVFEWVTDQLGAQATVCAGGRFDKLVEQLGGSPTPAIGFAMGAERLLLLMETLKINTFSQSQPDLFMMAVDQPTLQRALAIAETLRDALEIKVIVNTLGGSFKSQFKKADKSGARLALILGEEELAQDTISIKDLRNLTEQKTIHQLQLKQYILEILEKR